MYVCMYLNEVNKVVNAQRLYDTLYEWIWIKYMKSDNIEEKRKEKEKRRFLDEQFSFIL